MNEKNLQKNNRQVAIWLLIGVGMIVIQVVLGGITRLTESGLSITEWKPITGALPPLSEAAWQQEFEKYKNIDQFKYFHQHYTLSDFKFIFFWEWAHRFWARLIGLVFAAGFIYFIIKKKMNASMIKPMIILFLLGGIQGAIGWIMVKSGLVPEKYFVGHVELTTHFIAALILLFYTLWFALRLLPSFKEKIKDKAISTILNLLLVLVFFQLVFGGFMAGLKAAPIGSSWPLINLPANFDDIIYCTHFFHRGIAYVLFFAGILFFVKGKKFAHASLFNRLRWGFFLFLLIQVLLGISTLMSASSINTETGKNTLFVILGVTHQFIAMVLVMYLCALRFLVRSSSRT
ncbi:MAG: heme A synthase [Ferruginibacter sp.]|nr:heme A synthase [Ferruginibacter sp.]